METIKPEYMEKARQWFIDNCYACLAEVESGEVTVNDPKAYRIYQLHRIERHKAGAYDHCFTFLQKAYYLQTGESVALLP